MIYITYRPWSSNYKLSYQIKLEKKNLMCDKQLKNVAILILIANIWYGTVYQTNYTGSTAHSAQSRSTWLLNDNINIITEISGIFLVLKMYTKKSHWTRRIILKLIWFDLITGYNENYLRIACTNELMNYFEAKILFCVLFISYKWVCPFLILILASIFQVN